MTWRLLLAACGLLAVGVLAAIVTSTALRTEPTAAPAQPAAGTTAPSSPAAPATPSTTAPAQATTAAPATPTSVPEATPPAASLTEAYQADLGELAARSGVALVPVGGGEATRLGAVDSDVAWSTIKVPLAVAAASQDGWESVRAQAQPAITVSDNDTARALWARLGEGEEAASAVEAVLAAGGDSTEVSAQVSRPPFTPFGQTRWPVAAQATTMATLVCRDDAATTVALMRHVDPSQRWGLGRDGDAPIKGGWGPLDDGAGYLVRQMGTLSTPNGEVAVAVLVRAPGGFEAGVADVDRIVDWLTKHLPDLPAGTC